MFRKRRRREPGDYFHYDEQPIDQQVGTRVKKVIVPWKARWRFNGRERFLFCPAGYLYDGGSIPRLAWTALGITPSGPGDGAFLFHDIPYRAMGGLKPDAYCGASITNANGNAVCISREEADWGMYEGLRKGEIAAHRCRIAWLFVRALGGVLKHWGGPMPCVD